MAKTESKNNNTKNKNYTKLKSSKSPVNSSLSLEISSILIICFSILLMISIFFGGGGFLGKALSSFFKGLFGIGAYLFPIIMIVCSVYIFFSKSNKINIFKLVLSIVAFILLVSFFHILTKQDTNNFSNYFTYLANEYKTGKFLDGGILGALIGDLFLKIMGVFASYIVIIILFVASIFLLTGKSFFQSMYKWFKNLSNYFYYEYDVKEDEYDDEEEIDIPFRKRESMFSKIKSNWENNKQDKYYKENISYKEDSYYKRDFNPKIARQSTSQNIVAEHSRRTLKRYNNYIFDGTDRYRRIQKPVFFDMNTSSKNNKDKKIIFAIDEINNPQKYRNINNNVSKNNFNENQNNNFVNKNLYNDFEHLKCEDNIYKSTANIVNDFEQNIKNTKTSDLFEIKSKENFINDVYKKKKVDIPNSNFDIDLKFIDDNIDEIFENPPEEFLSDNTENNNLNNLDNFYNFDKNIENNDISYKNIENNQDNFINQDINFNENVNIKNDNNAQINNHNIQNYNTVYDDTKNNNVDDSLDINTNKNDILANDITLNNEDDPINDDCPFDLDSPIQYNRTINQNINQENQSSYIKKDNDGFTIINQDTHNTMPQKNIQNNHIQNNSTQNNTIQNINEPVIIKPDVEKMVSISQSEKENIKKEYIFPKLSFLSKNVNETNENNDIELRDNSYILVKTLKSFNVSAQVINISKGPSVTRYELSIEDGIKVSKILGLADNLALSLAASSIRIEAPIPGKSAVGIEIPNKEVKSVFLSEVICAEKFQKFPSKVAFGLGKDITGNVIVTDIAKMPHMLIAGATGSGKSVCINTLITSILYKANPNEVKLMMIDPKVVELSVYNGIPHLLTPVVTEPEKAAGVLNWAVSEMMDRYNLFAQTGTRNLVGYNSLKEEKGEEKLPQIVIIIDELADLMMVAAKEVEASICRLAQLARAAGIHLIIATQRPSVDVITGLIKANIPSRIAFAVSSGTDSRTVLDTVGAEKLLGKGDMLFRSVDMNKPLRIQGAFISDKEVEHIVTFIKDNSSPNYDETIINKIESSSKSSDSISSDSSDEITEDVIAFLVKKGKASTSMIQRQFRIGYNRAARIIEELEDRGIVSSENGSKQRDVLMDRYQYEEYQNRYDKY